MIANYYETLQLTPKATNEEIASNYRKLALRYHPKTTKENQFVAAQIFNSLAEAYQVLSDPLKRAFFDKYGYQKLKEGLYGEGSLNGGYRYGNNASQIFDNFFKNQEEMDKVLDTKVKQKGSLFGHAFGGLNYRDNTRYQDLIVTVACTLEELYKGTSKIVNYSKKVRNSDGRTTSMITVAKNIHIKAGYGTKTVLTFSGQGHQSVQGKISDLLFVIEQLLHPNYSRKGDDLIYNHWMSLADAFECGTINLTTLDGRSLSVGVDYIVNPRSLHELSGQGMLNEETGKRGSLFIHFSLTFPLSLSQNVRKQLRTLLR